ncbi:hypothetical protein B0H16DRAFT_1472357 [Mycena metata]|uniref:Uncharacterized protein n=1 Tax=Mycena metata TaxID=1033252 RepID=A0AAD7HP06_9AGAR|nr:hypothetical protein B0H16DRAFT_1472357 [Mycena metata]
MNITMNRFKADIGVCLIVVRLLLFVDVPPPPPDHLTQPEDPFTGMPWSRHLEKLAVYQLLGHATTFSILTPLAAAVCAESDNQQDMEPEDSEPYLNTSDSDTTIATMDTEAAGPTPPLPPNNKKCSGGPLPPPCQGWPLIDANGCIFAMLTEDPLTSHPHWLHADPVGWNRARKPVGEWVLVYGVHSMS